MSAQAFRDARDTLLDTRTDLAAARERFAWPVLDRFNWALDWFDAWAGEHPDVPALWIESDEGTVVRLSFGELADRSDRAATWLRQQGVGRGDRVLLMLPNRVELWEALLGAMKLGAVVVPATTLLARADLQDRIGRGHVRHLIVDAAHTADFDGLADGLTRVVVGGHAQGWTPFALADESGFEPDGETKATDPLLLY